VVLILGILAAVVIVNVVGLTGRGQAESYATDEKTIQTVVSAFYADVHAYNNNVAVGWNEMGNHTSFHNYPTASGRYYYYYKDESDEFSLHLGREDTVNGYNVRVVMRQDKDGSPPRDATTEDVAAAAIWMGLLVNGPREGTNSPDKDTSAPLAGEYGPYLNPLPKSCSQNNSLAGSGTITWIVGEYGRVYGVFKNGDMWYAGFGGRYP
jgi:type II secretory pathway pseudopilin PulG